MSDSSAGGDDTAAKGFFLLDDLVDPVGGPVGAVVGHEDDPVGVGDDDVAWPDDDSAYLSWVTVATNRRISAAHVSGSSTTQA